MKSLLVVCAFALVMAQMATVDAVSNAHVDMPWGSTANVTVLTTGSEARKHLYRAQMQFPSLIYCYDPLDVNSVRLAPTIGTVSAALQGFANVFALSTREPSTQLILDTWGVQATPMMKLLPAQGKGRKIFDKTPLKGVGAGTRTPVDYTERDQQPDTIRRWVLSYLPDKAITRYNKDDDKTAVVEATDKALEDEEAKKDMVVLFTDKDQSSQLYKALSMSFVGRLNFVEVNAKKAKKIADNFRVERTPSLMVFSGKKNKAKRIHGPVRYEGKLNIAELTVFLDQYAPSAAKYEEKREKKQQKAVRKLMAAASKGPINQVTDAVSWFQDVLQRPKISGLLFSDPTANAGADHKEVLAQLSAMLRSEKGKKATKGSKFFWIDKSKNPQLAEAFFGHLSTSEDQPQNLVFFNPKKELVTKYVGALSESSILSFIQGKIASGTGAKPLSPEDLPDFEEQGNNILLSADDEE